MLRSFFQWASSKAKQDMSLPWRQDNVHEWYVGSLHGDALIGTSSRRDEMVLVRLSSEYTRAQRHIVDLKVHPTCPNSNMI
ncbi:hypothetical protein TNCV_1022631 [Trichonephila clavipes]|nr:hypothetical protein TNCV_1022631 [Trichonephila clavipes]